MGAMRRLCHLLLVLVATWVVSAARAAPVPAPVTLKARLVSWDVGWKPPTEAAWIARVVSEVQAAGKDGMDVLVFPELFAWGLAPYAPPGTRPAEFVTQRLRAALLPAVQAAAPVELLVVLGTYPHQEPGWSYVYNRAAVLLGGGWRFADKLDPTQSEAGEDPAVRPGAKLPLFAFRGGTAAVLTCFSLEKPEVAVALKKAGVQLVLGPAATMDGDGVARILRSASARAVELGAAVLVAPLLGEQAGWKNQGSAALFLPAQHGIDARPQVSALRTFGLHRDDFAIPYRALLALRQQSEKSPETRPFLAPTPEFSVERVVP